MKLSRCKPLASGISRADVTVRKQVIDARVTTADQLRAGGPIKRANADDLHDPHASLLPGKLLEHLLVATDLTGTPDQVRNAALVLDSAARDFGADILVIELARAAGRFPLELLRGLTKAVPCDLLLARTQTENVDGQRRLQFEGP